MAVSPPGSPSHTIRHVTEPEKQEKNKYLNLLKSQLIEIQYEKGKIPLGAIIFSTDDLDLSNSAHKDLRRRSIERRDPSDEEIISSARNEFYRAKLQDLNQAEVCLQAQISKLDHEIKQMK